MWCYATAGIKCQALALGSTLNVDVVEPLWRAWREQLIGCAHHDIYRAASLTLHMTFVECPVASVCPEDAIALGLDQNNHLTLHATR